MIERFARFVLCRRWLIIGIIALLSAAAAFGALRLRFDNSLEIWFVEGDPGIERYREFIDLFGTDEILILAWEADDVFDRDNLERIRRVEDRAAGVGHVQRTMSLVSAEIPRDENGDVVVGPLFEPAPDDPALLEARKRAALASPFLTSALVSKDGKATAVVLEIDHIEGEFEYKRELLAALRAILDEERARDGTEIVLAGTADLDRAFFDYTERDMILFLPIIFICICIAILVIFRRAAAVVIPLCVVSIAILWTFGIQGLLGWKVTVVSSMLAPLLMAMGIADAVHVVTEYLDELLDGRTRNEAAVNALVKVWRPCLFTSLTTAAGFLSLLVSDIQPVRRTGMLAAIGVMVALVVTVVLVPALLTVVKSPDSRYLERLRSGVVTRMLGVLGRGGMRRSWITVIVAALLVGTAFWGVSRLEIGTNMLDFFRKDAPSRQAVEYVDRTLGGVISSEYLIKADGEHGYLTADRLKRLDTYAEYIRKQPNITGVHSLVEILKELDAALRGLPADQGTVPDSRELIAQYMLLLEGNEQIERFVLDDGALGRFAIRVQMGGASRLAERVPEIDRYRKTEIETEGFEVEGTGLVPLMNRMERYLLQSQIRSFGLAFTVITLMMIGLLRSVRLGLFGMIPNLVPVLLTLGFMGFAQIRLDIGTVMIASVALGLVVDASIHLLARLQRELPLVDHDMSRALARAIQTSGRPILATGLVLTLGFWTLLFASFSPNIYFGFLSGVTIFTSLIADLVFLPAALRIVRPRLLPRDKQQG